jgi:hypothetical protein
LGEEDIRHLGIVVLAGMHQSLFRSAQVSESAQHGRNFHEVRPRPNDVKNMHAQSLLHRMNCSFYHKVDAIPPVSSTRCVVMVQTEVTCASSCTGDSVTSLRSPLRSKTAIGTNAAKPSR